MGTDSYDNVFLWWSKLVPINEGQDPLGLNLRVSFRLANQLSYCITSITPRARYYSFIPWCVADWIKREKGKSLEQRLRDSVIHREKAMVLGSVIHHNGNPCQGGGLIGSSLMTEWFLSKFQDIVDLNKFKHVKNPAYGIYISSLFNLGLFESTEDKSSVLKEYIEDEIADFEEFQLTPLGQKIADSYGAVVNKIDAARKIDKNETFYVRELKQWGAKGGLCELMSPAAPDKEPLIDLFFNRIGNSNPSHKFRRETLLLLLFLSMRLSENKLKFNSDNFRDAVYFNRVKDLDIVYPLQLNNISLRWRMFYFHYFITMALESIFVNVVDRARAKGVEGFRLEDMIEDLRGRNICENLKHLLGIKIFANFLELSPNDVFNLFDLRAIGPNPSASVEFDEAVTLSHPLSETNLSRIVLQKDLLRTPEGTVILLILISVVLTRYIQWDDSKYGNWLAQAVDNPFKDITVPVIFKELKEKFGKFLNTPWYELALFIINRYVVSQHEVLAYDRSWDGSKIYFHSDEGRIFWRYQNYDNPVYGNSRFHTAVQILKDLSLLKESEKDKEILELTGEGQALFEKEMKKEEEN